MHVILIRHADETRWRTPSTTSYADERALQELIARSPSLLPGTTDAPIAVVREFPIPSTGYIDVLGVDASGTITLVECKLRANPEIRRQVVGQVLAYAAGLWGLSYEIFDATFTAINGQPLADQLRSLSVGEWNEEQFRATVATNLSQGRFRLIIVVDQLTDELKQIVLYLNQHTGDTMHVLALELGYIADNNIEILVPKSYGEESTQPKTNNSRQRWTEEAMFTKLAACCEAEGMTAIYALYTWFKERGAQLYWSNGSLAWVSAQLPIGGKQISLVSIGEWPENRGVVSINFEYLRGLIPHEALQRLADRLRGIPGMNEIYANLESKEFRQRPNLPINQILIQPGAHEIIENALDELLRADALRNDAARTNYALSE
jgi:hypothetical protein